MKQFLITSFFKIDQSGLQFQCQALVKEKCLFLVPDTFLNKNSEKEETTATVVDEPEVEVTPTESNDDLFSGYKLIEVDGGDLSGYRESNVVVDIGYGEREYWAFTNEYGQLVRVIADEIILQDDSNEPVLSSGRYYSDEAKVPGVKMG